MDAADSNYNINNFVGARWPYNHPQIIKVHLDTDELVFVHIPAICHIMSALVSNPEVPKFQLIMD